LALYFASAPIMEVSITASGPITPFQDLLGFSDIGVSGTVTLNQKIQVQFVDPDDMAPFSWREWTQTAIEDLAEVAFVDATGNDVEGILTFDSDLVDGSADGSLSLLIADLSLYEPPTSPLPEPTITLGTDLANLANVAPNDVLAGLGQFAIAIGAAQVTNDVQLPYLKHSLGAGFEPGRALFELAKQQADAFIMCGPADTSPPSGDPTAGGTIYCQTFAPVDPVSVTWSLRDSCTGCGLDYGANLTETLGIRPTDNAEFSNLPAGVLPPIQVKFQDPPGTDETEGETHTVTPRVRSAQELLTDIQNLEGVTATLEFDSVTASLAYSITMDWDPDPTDTELVFGDQLRQAANLAGLTAGSGADASFDVDGAHLAATFGVILVDDYADITPLDAEEPRADDRFFMVVDPDAPEFEADTVTTTVSVDLTGRIGYLEVGVEGDPDSNPVDDIDYQVVAIDGGQPILAVDILPREGGVPISGTSPISNAILVRAVTPAPTSAVP
jgi:hypothetical protein